MQSGAAQTLRVIGELDAIGRKRQIRESRDAAQRIDEGRDITPQQRLAARQPDAVHTQADEHTDQPLDLFERQDVFPRQPHVLFLRHAVLTPEIAAVGDGDPQAAQRASENVSGRGQGLRQSRITTQTMTRAD